MEYFDTLIKRGHIVDGTGLPAFYGDVGIRDGRIARIGNLGDAEAATVIDAQGKIVAPGYVTSHAHYDAAIFWDPYISCAGESGVTTVVNANCGFGFAPVRPEDRERTMMMLSTTEEIPVTAQRAALKWDWVTFEEWLDRVQATPKGVNVATFLPMNPVLVYVMGVEGAKTRRPTAEEMAEIHRIINNAMDAGALGISMSCMGAEGNSHVDSDGTCMPTDVLHRDDAVEICRALAERGEGIVQILAEIFTYGDRTFSEKIAEAVKGTGVRVAHNSFNTSNEYPDWVPHDLQWLEEVRSRGLDITAPCRMNRSWAEASVTQLVTFIGYLKGVRKMTNALYHGVDELKRLITDPEFVQEFSDEYAATAATHSASTLDTLTIIDVGDNPDLQQYLGMTVSQIAESRGSDIIPALLWLAAESDLALQMRSVAFSASTPDQGVMALRHPAVVPSGSDGGAHTKTFDQGHFQHDLLIWMVRDEGVMSLEDMHFNLSLKHARAMDIFDRGAILPGYWADILIYEIDNLHINLDRYEIAHDLPNGEWRRKGTAGGYDYILVNGVVTHEQDRSTGATPGQLVRSAGVQQLVQPQLAQQIDAA